MIRFCLLALALLAFAGAAGVVDTFSIQGAVSGNTTNHPAFVIAIDDANQISEAPVDANGVYILADLIAGNYVLSAEVYAADNATLLAQGEYPHTVTLGPSADNIDIALVPVESPPPSIVGEVVYHGGQTGVVVVTLGNHTQALTTAPYVFEFAEIADGIYPIHVFMDTNGNGAWQPGEPAGEHEPVTVPPGAAALSVSLHETGDEYEPDNGPDTAARIYPNHPQFRTFHLSPDPLVRIIADAAPDIDHVRVWAGPGLAEFATRDLRGGVQPILVLTAADGTVLADGAGSLSYSFAENTEAILSLHPDPNGAVTGSYILAADFAAPRFFIAGHIIFQHLEPQPVTLVATDANGRAVTATAAPFHPFEIELPAGSYSITASLANDDTVALPSPIDVPPSRDDLFIVFAGAPPIAPDVYEPDNAPDQAAPIAKLEVQRHSIHQGDLNVVDVDHVVFHAQAGAASVHFLETSHELGLEFTLTDGAGNEVPAIDTSPQREALPSWAIPAAGDYILRIAPTTGAAGYYTFSLDFDGAPVGPDAFEPDNLPEDASSIALDEVQMHTIHPLDDANLADVDHIRFYAYPGTVHPRLHTGLDLALALFDAAGNELPQITYLADGPFIDPFWYVDAEGEYTLRVEPFQPDVTGGYQLALEFNDEPNVVPDEYEPDNSATDANPIANLEVQTHTIHSGNLAVIDVDHVVFHAFYGDVHPLVESAIPLTLTLFDAAGNELPKMVYDAAREDVNIPHEPFWFVGQEGDYTLRIEATNPSDTGRYHLKLAFNDEPLFIAGQVEGVDPNATVVVRAANNEGTIIEGKLDGGRFHLDVPPGSYHVSAVMGTALAEFANNPVSVPPNAEHIDLVFAPPPVEPDLYEPDNEQAAAKPIADLEVQHHSIHRDAAGGLDTDHVVFHAHPGDVWVDLATSDGLHLAMSLFDVAGNELPMIYASEREGGFPQPHPLWIIQTEGDYTLRLAPFSSSTATGNYSIKLDFADSATARIAGIVTGVNAARIIIWDAFTDGPPIAELGTDANGAFAAMVPAPGSYVVDAKANHVVHSATVQVPPDVLDLVFDFTPPPVGLQIQVAAEVTESPIDFHLIFARPVQGLAASEIVVVNGVVSDLHPLNSGYLAQVTPVDPGTVTLTVPAGAALDANGVPNAEATATTFYHPEFGCDILPAWEPPVGVQNTMTMHIQIETDGQLVSAPGSLLAVFLDGEIRGVAEIAEGPAGPWFQLSIGSNEVTEEGLRLELFDTDRCDFCKVYGSFDFVADTTVGAIDAPVRRSACLTTQEMSLVPGWNWLSFNVAPADPSLNPALQLAPVASDHMEFKTAPSLGGVATYFGGSWIGMPDGIACGVRYLLNSDVARSLTVTGQPCDGPIPVVAGWNWIGFTPQQPLPVNVALANFAASNGDELKTAPHLGGTWTYFDDQWFGQGVPMQPGVGYLLRSGAAGELVYNSDPSLSLPIVTPTPGVSRAAPEWLPPTGIQNTMTLHASVDGVSAAGSKLAAFKDGQVRGVAELIEGPAGAQFILSIGSDQAQEPGITFAVYDAAADSVCDITQSIDFVLDTTAGLINDPLIFACESAEPLTIVDVQPTPLVIDENGSGSVSLTVLNTAGALNWSIGTAPANGSATVVEGIASYTPIANFAGDDSFVVLVSDGLSSDSATVLVEVLEAPEPPTLSYSPNPVVVAEDGVITITVAANEEELIWTHSEPSNGSFQPQILRVAIFEPGLRRFVYAPNANYHGSDGFTVSAANNGGATTLEIPITIEALNDPPVNVEPPYITGDGEVGATLTANSGLWHDNADLAPGAISFSYQWQVLYDGEENIPDATSDTLFVTEALAGQQLRVLVTATDDGETDTPASAVANSAWVEIAPLNPPELSQTPAADASIRLVEGGGSQTFSVAIAARTEISWSVDGQVVGQGPSFTYAPGHDTVTHPDRSRAVAISASVDGANVSWSDVRVADIDRLPPLPAIAISPATPSTVDDLVVEILEQQADPDGDSIGSYAVSWALLGNARQAFTGMELPASETQKHNLWEASVRPVTNPYGDVDTATPEATSVTVLVVNSVPEAAILDTVLTGIGASVDITLGGSDADLQDALSFIIGEQPEHGSLILTGDTVTYTPNPNYIGADSFSYAVSDGEAQSDSIVVDILVQGWLLPIAVTEAQVEDLLIGMHGQATDGFDVGIDGVAAPGGQDTATLGFEADGQLLGTDLRAIGEEADWILSIDASQAIDEVVVSWNTGAVPGLGLFLEELEGELSIDMRAVNQLTIAPGEVRRFRIHYGVVEFVLHLHKGWNIFSVPVRPLNTNVDAVLGETGGVWEWLSYAAAAREDDPTGEFVAADEIVPKKGYFVLSGEAREIIIRGSIVSDSITPLQRHWTLFGVVSAPPFGPRHPAAALDPGELEIRSHIWRWNGRRYRRSKILHAGLGYWVYCDFPIFTQPFREAAPDE